MAGHALLSPSAASRWMHCTPSAWLESLLPDKTSRYAEEGTAAHALAALKLKRALGMNYGAESAEVERLRRFVDADMERHTDSYAAYVLEHCREVMNREGSAPYVDVERTVRTDIKELFGTADALIMGQRELCVIDFKYGAGVPVSARENPQLRIYAIGALAVVPAATTVTTAIYQPRRDSVSTERLDAAMLRQWFDRFVRPSAERAAHGDGWETPGPWCRFCRCAPECLALALMGLGQGGVGNVRSHLLPPAAIASLLNLIPVIEIWIKGVRALAMERAQKGERINGWTLDNSGAKPKLVREGSAKSHKSDFDDFDISTK